MEIDIKMFDKSAFSLVVNCSDSIENLKKEIESKSGVPVKKQHLSLAGRELKNELALSDYDVKSRHLSVSRRKLALSEHDVKSRPTLLLNVKRFRCIKIFVNVPTGKEVTLEVDPNDFIDDVKMKIQDEVGIPPQSQNLTLNGKNLEDGHSVSYYKIQGKSILHLDLKSARIGSMQISINNLQTRRVITLEVKPDSSIEDVKNQVKDIEGIFPEQQCLIFRGKELKNGSTLNNWDIKKDAMLYLRVLEIKVHVEKRCSPGKRVTLELKPSDTIKTLKDKIQEKEWIKPEQQCVMFNGQQMEHSRTLGYYRVENESTLHLIPFPVFKQIYVNTPAGKKIVLDVEQNDTIRMVLEKIKELEETPPGEIFGLKYKDKLLAYNRTLCACSIPEDPDLYVVDAGR